MRIVVCQSGIDVAKDELVVSIDGARPFTRPNDPQGCFEVAQLVGAGGVVHLEATGGYERLVRRTLVEAGIRVALHNPLKVRRLAQAQGVRAKTDRVDAKVLSGVGCLLPQTKVKSLSRQHLADHSRAIDALKAHVCECKKRMAMPELDEFARQLYAQAIQATRALHRSTTVRESTRKGPGSARATKG
jgi:transposase